jgi:hypothetical protein
LHATQGTFYKNRCGPAFLSPNKVCTYYKSLALTSSKERHTIHLVVTTSSSDSSSSSDLKAPTGKLALLPAFQTYPQPKGLDQTYQQYNQTGASSDGSSPRISDLPSAGGSATSFTTYSSTNGGPALVDSRNNSPERKPVLQQPAYQLASSTSQRPEYPRYQEMATTAQHHYAPTHGYLDNHHLQSSHMSHDGGLPNTTSYASYQPPMLPSTHGSYAQNYAPTTHYPYVTAPMTNHHYGNSIPSISSLSCKQVACVESTLVLIDFLSHVSANPALCRHLFESCYGSIGADCTSWQQEAQDHSDTLGR